MQGQPVVVQGTAVSDPYGGTATYGDPPTYGGAQTYAAPAGGGFANALNDPQVQVQAGDTPQRGPVVRGEKQATRCRDPIFAVLLYICVGAIIAVALIMGRDAIEETMNNTSSTSNTTEDFHGYIYTAIICGLISLVLSAIGLAAMFRFPEILIKAALIFSVFVAALVVVFAIMQGTILLAVFGAIFFIISCCYACCVWSRIPFATANMVTAITAIKSNCGVTAVAYFFTILAACWTLVWTLAMAGVWDETFTCDANGDCTNPNYGILFGMFLAYFFTHEVIKNSIHVTVAGVVGTWWFAPDESKGCCTPALKDSFVRTLTTSFGSICFGSLLVAILQALRQLANYAQQEEGGFMFCIAECILGCLESLLEYFNKWAFIYVGLYGYGYLEAGKNVFTLFQNRGWEAVIADDLVNNVLWMVSILVGLITGCVGLAIEATNSDWFDNGNVPGSTKLVCFIIGFIIGLAVCNILMNTVGSAVNAIIVLFAEAPAEFEQNYPDLSRRMREVWSQIVPL